MTSPGRPPDSLTTPQDAPKTPLGPPRKLPRRPKAKNDSRNVLWLPWGGGIWVFLGGPEDPSKNPEGSQGTPGNHRKSNGILGNPREP